MVDIQRIIDYTNVKLQDWYDNAKRDFDVIGSGKCTYQNNLIQIDYVEGGEDKTWNYGFYPDEKIDFYFNVWMEQA